MKKTSFLSIFLYFLCVSFSSYADIVKWTDSEGNVHFSDSIPPVSDGSKVQYEKIETKQTNSATFDLQKSNEVTNYSDNKSARVPIISIISPSDGEAIRENSGNVTITVQIANVDSSDKIVLYVDGQPYQSRNGEGSIVVSITNMSRGGHSVSVRVMNSSGKSIGSKSSSFNVLRVHA